MHICSFVLMQGVRKQGGRGKAHQTGKYVFDPKYLWLLEQNQEQWKSNRSIIFSQLVWHKPISMHKPLAQQKQPFHTEANCNFEDKASM